jgi:hypothetical protein
MFNFPLPLLALLVANRAGDSSEDAGRVALLAMLIRPPMMGLLVAMELAKQATGVLKEPVVRRALKGLSSKDARRWKQLETAVLDLQRTIEDVRDGSRPARSRSRKPGKKSP